MFQEAKEVLGAMRAMQALDWEKVFYVDPSIGEDVIGAMLLQKRKESQSMKLVYCVSRVKTMG